MSDDVIRKALGLGRANAIAQVIADEPPAHTLAAAVAKVKEPFDAALLELALLREAVERAGSLPLSVPEARYDELQRLDELHRRLGVLPPQTAVYDDDYLAFDEGYGYGGAPR